MYLHFSLIQVGHGQDAEGVHIVVHHAGGGDHHGQGAQGHGLQHGLVAAQHAVGVDVHGDGPAGLLLHKVLELQAGQVQGVVFRADMPQVTSVLYSLPPEVWNGW